MHHILLIQEFILVAWLRSKHAFYSCIPVQVGMRRFLLHFLLFFFFFFLLSEYKDKSKRYILSDIILFRRAAKVWTSPWRKNVFGNLKSLHLRLMHFKLEYIYERHLLFLLSCTYIVSFSSVLNNNSRKYIVR